MTFCHFILRFIWLLTHIGEPIANYDGVNNLVYICFLIGSITFYFTMSIVSDRFYFRVGKDFRYNKDAIKKETKIFDQESLEGEQRRIETGEGETDAITINDVKKVFKVKNKQDFYALKGSTFSLRQNEILGILGPNGAGKSTTFNILSANLTRSDGEMKLAGKNFDHNKEFFVNTGCCFQEDILWDDFDVNQHFTIFGLIRGVPKHIMKKWMKIMNLTNFGKNSVKQLSSGMKRKVCISLAMACNPKYKFFDEPSTGLDPIARNDLRMYIKQQRDLNQGSTIFTTHTMSEAEQLCDRLAILVNGGYSCIMPVHEMKRKAAGYKLILYFKHESSDKNPAFNTLKKMSGLKWETTLEEPKQARIKIEYIEDLSNLFREL